MYNLSTFLIKSHVVSRGNNLESWKLKVGANRSFQKPNSRRPQSKIKELARIDRPLSKFVQFIENELWFVDKPVQPARFEAARIQRGRPRPLDHQVRAGNVHPATTGNVPHPEKRVRRSRHGTVTKKYFKKYYWLKAKKLATNFN